MKSAHHIRHRLHTVIIMALAMVIVSWPLCAKDFTVVIDPGHGGHDHGAPGRITNEKSVNLAVALKLGELLKNECKDIKVVYTRSNDTFVPLQGRADIANKANGDLFISIHTNSVDKSSKRRNTVSGAAVYTLGFKRSQENLEVAMRENAVMKLEADYTTRYEGFDPNSTESYIIFEMSQNKHMQQSINAAQAVQNELIHTAGRRDMGVRQANFWVLFKTAMPAMLVELDFICNPTQEKFLNSKDGQRKLAQAICNGVKTYRKESTSADFGSNVSPAVKSTGQSAETTPAAPSRRQMPDSDSSQPILYKIQILTSSYPLPNGSKEFKGLSPIGHYTDGAMDKYTYGEYNSIKAATPDLKKIKKLFPDAFIIKMQGNKRVR